MCPSGILQDAEEMQVKGGDGCLRKREDEKRKLQ
jgi:hypothetical protein